MCIIGCAAKMKLSDDLTLISEGKKEFEDLKNDSDYLFEETIFPVMFNPEEITDFGRKYNYKTRSKILEAQYSKMSEWAKLFVKDIRMLKNTHLFQGTMVTAEGTAKSPKAIEKFLQVLQMNIYSERTPYQLKNEGSARPFAFSLLKKGKDNFVIKAILVFTHNRNIKSYLYQFPKSSFMLNPTLTKKYLKQNKDLKQIDKKEGFKTIYLETEKDIPNLKKLKKTVFLAREEGLLKKVVEKNRAILGVGLLV
ncbi:MAG: hypothetical protein ISS01_02810 [Nanoarchaeota archaeon]|nr:hypothetical protein [Nanoarchaeota archaeon]